MREKYAFLAAKGTNGPGSPRLERGQRIYGSPAAGRSLHRNPTRGRGGDAARRWGDRRRGGHHLARRGPAPIAGGGAHPCSRSCQAAERCPRWHRSAVGGSELAVCASLSSNAGGVRRCALRRLMHALAITSPVAAQRRSPEEAHTRARGRVRRQNGAQGGTDQLSAAPS